MFMRYFVKNNKIIFERNDDFDAKSILECGQLFRYFKTDKGYDVITGDKLASVYEENGSVVIESESPEVFIEYFDLNTDYSEIKKELEKYDFLKEPIKKGKGIRIVKANPEETILQFIISQNNNIKRIQKIIERLSEIGKPINEKYRAFPSCKELSKMPRSFFEGLGAGYRAGYLEEVSKVLADINLEEKKLLNDDELYEWLLSLKGVGPKVASCIMLFGFNRSACFPVDTWIEKVYRTYFYEGEKTRPQISKFLQNKFGAMSGITQQYLFYYIREQS